MILVVVIETRRPQATFRALPLRSRTHASDVPKHRWRSNANLVLVCRADRSWPVGLDSHVLPLGFGKGDMNHPARLSPRGHESHMPLLSPFPVQDLSRDLFSNKTLNPGKSSSTYLHRGPAPVTLGHCPRCLFASLAKLLEEPVLHVHSHQRMQACNLDTLRLNTRRLN